MTYPPPRTNQIGTCSAERQPPWRLWLPVSVVGAFTALPVSVVGAFTAVPVSVVGAFTALSSLASEATDSCGLPLFYLRLSLSLSF